MKTKKTPLGYKRVGKTVELSVGDYADSDCSRGFQVSGTSKFFPWVVRTAKNPKTAERAVVKEMIRQCKAIIAELEAYEYKEP